MSGKKARETIADVVDWVNNYRASLSLTPFSLARGVGKRTRNERTADQFRAFKRKAMELEEAGPPPRSWGYGMRGPATKPKARKRSRWSVKATINL